MLQPLLTAKVYYIYLSLLKDLNIDVRNIESHSNLNANEAN